MAQAGRRRHYIPCLEGIIEASSGTLGLNNKCFKRKEKKEREFMGGQMDIQESKKDKQMGIKHSILYYLRLQ